MKTVFLTGHTEIITNKILEQVSRRFSVVLTSEKEGREEDEARVYHVRPGTTAFEQLFWAYDFNAVWYFCPCCDAAGHPEDLSELKSVYVQCRENSVKKLIVVSSSLLPDSQIQEEEKILFKEEEADIQVVVLRIPWVITDQNRDNRLGRLFHDLYRHARTITLPDILDDNYEFLSLADVIRLMKKITLSARESGSYHLPGEFVISKEQLRSKAYTICSRSSLLFEGDPLSYSEKGDISHLVRKYGYSIKDKKELDFEKLYEEFSGEEIGRFSRIASFFSKVRSKISGKFAKVMDIVVLFVAAEYISGFISDFVYFREIDVRLIYIFLIATSHGLRSGVIAALAECVVLFFEYQSLGITGLQLFYNVENWIPFVLCIMTGAVTGYYSDLKEDEKKLVDRENRLLREKYLFLNDMYKVSSEARDEYRRQILTFDNSYGKIYDALEQMTCNSVTEVCIQTRKILEELLENPSAAIYQWKPGEKTARRIAFSSGEGESRWEMLDVEKLKSTFSVIGRGEIWRNVQLAAEAPMYAAQVIPVVNGHEELRCDHLIIVLWDALPEQMNDYYANQFEILCRLAANAVNRAALLEYHNAHTE